MSGSELLAFVRWGGRVKGEKARARTKVEKGKARAMEAKEGMEHPECSRALAIGAKRQGMRR